MAKWAERVRNTPIVSTLLASFALSSIWLLVWLFVFFLSTWLVNIETSKGAFIMVLWLSVAAESVIRFFENTDGIAFFAKPHEVDATGDNKDFKSTKMAILLLTGLVLVFLYRSLISEDMKMISFDPPYQFTGMNGGTGILAFKEMLLNWLDCMQDSVIITSIVVSFLFRVVIYKRSHIIV